MRFKEFTNETIKTTLGKIADYKKGPFGSALKKNIFVPKNNETIKVYEQQNAINKDYRLERYFITKEYSKTMHSFFVGPGDFIVSCAGTIGEIYELPKEAPVGVINQALMRVRVYEKTANKEWFKFAFLKMISEFSSKYSNGSAIKNIPPFSDLKSYSIYLPAIEEQRKIASLLSAIEEQIEVQNKIISDLSTLRMQISYMFFSKRSLSFIPLSKCFTYGKAGGTPKSTIRKYYDGPIPFLSITDMTEQGKNIRSTKKRLSKEGIENSSSWIVPKDSLIFSMYASVGLVSINRVELATSQAMYSMVIQDKQMLDYLYYFLGYFAKYQIHKYLETGTQSNVNADFIRTISVPVYSKDYSNKFINLMNLLDEEQQNEKSLLYLLVKQKNYFLSNLFI